MLYMMKKGVLIGILISFMLIMPGCSLFFNPDGAIKQPGKPNVIQYASEMEVEQWDYKIANSVIKHGMPGYSLKDDGNVDVLIRLQDAVTKDDAIILADKYGGQVVDGTTSEETDVIIRLKQQDFWRLVKDPMVKKVGVPVPPEKLLNRIKK